MNLTSEQQQDIGIIRVKGRIDAITSAEFETQLFTLANEHWRKIILNFGDCEFINSNGLRILLLLRKRMGAPGRVVVCHLQVHIRNVFEIAGFDTIFPVFTSEAEAVIHLHAHPIPQSEA